MQNEQVAQASQHRLFLVPPPHNVCLWPPLPKKAQFQLVWKQLEKVLDCQGVFVTMSAN